MHNSNRAASRVRAKASAATRAGAGKSAVETSYTLFTTPIGECGLVWNARGICALQLPEASSGATRARLLRKAPQARRVAPPPAIRRAIGAIVRLLQGKSRELGALAIDYGGATAFHRRVCEAARAIPAGQTLTYGELAAKLGQPGAARAVGSVMARNALPIIVPCHRVMAAGGRPGGFSAHGGVDTKLRMLRIEGALRR